jgi:ribosomal protein S27AE
MDNEDNIFYDQPRWFWDANLYSTPDSFISKQVIPKNKKFQTNRYVGDRDEYDYLSRPTEMNARLNEFRYHYNLDPKKKYTAEDMKKIINDHNNYKGSFKNLRDELFKSSRNNMQSLDELLKIIGNDPQKLADLHNNVVKNKTSYASDAMPQVKNGGLLRKNVSCSNCGWSWNAADGGYDPMTCHKCGGTVKMKSGGQHGGLDRWFAEKWVDVKTGKACGRQEGEKRAGYPACRPSKRVNSQTPKTSSEMSSAEKDKFKRTKTSSERIPYNHKKMQFAGQVSSADSVRNIAGNILKYEELRGGPGGSPLPYYSDPSYMKMLMEKVYPEVKKIMPGASAMEAGEAMDFIFNAGWDKTNNKITKDPRAYALQEYYRQYDPSKLDADGKWSGRKNPAYSFDKEYANTIGKLPENKRRVLMNKGRDWYYRNINNPAPGVPNSDYYDTWYGRIWNTNQYAPFNPNNPKFKYKK